MQANLLIVDDFQTNMPAPYRLLHTLTKGHTNSVNCAAFCHDGDHLATGGDDSRLIIWNVKKGIAQYIIELNSPVLSVLWDSRWHSTLICGCEDGNAIVLNNFHVCVSFIFDRMLIVHPSYSNPVRPSCWEFMLLSTVLA